MVYATLPTSKGFRYHTGLYKEVLDQNEQPGRATMHKANYDRMMRVLTQLEPHGDYTEEEEDQFDEDEIHHLVTTDIGNPAIPNDGHLIRRNRRKYRREPSLSSETSTMVSSKVSAEDNTRNRTLTEQTAFTEYGTDNPSIADMSAYTESYVDSVATEMNSIYDPSTASTISDEAEEMTFEYDSDNSDHTVCDQLEGLARPRAGWNTSSFPSFGSIIPVANNTKLLPKAPNTARLHWMVATNSSHGRNSGISDNIYLKRVAQVFETRLKSRTTSEQTKRILARNPDLMPPSSNWSKLTIEVWGEKFPHSSIQPDSIFQYLWDTNKNRDLPSDQFSATDMRYVRDQPMKESNIFKRTQKAVSKQTPTTENQWSREDQERVQNQAHVARAQNQIQNVQPDNLLINALLEFDEYVNHFLANGHKWQKPAGLSKMISKVKNITEQSAFEKAFFLNTEEQVRGK